MDTHDLQLHLMVQGIYNIYNSYKTLFIAIHALPHEVTENMLRSMKNVTMATMFQTMDVTQVAK